jgi:putative membrane protein
VTPNDPVWTTWDPDASVVAGLAVLCLAYALGVRGMPNGEPLPAWRRLAFLAAVAVIVVALMSPMHGLAERYLFSAHMVQHLLLTMVVPPLLLSAVPAGMARLLPRHRAVFLVVRAVTRPIPAFVAANLVFLVWHLPRLYDSALRDHTVHVASHLLFIGTATALWWPLLSPLPELPRLPHAGRLLYVFAQVLPGMIVGGLVVNAKRPLYALYAEAPRITSLTAVQDQQLGALIMWVGGGLFWLVAFTAIFFAWVAPDISSIYGKVAAAPATIPASSGQSGGDKPVALTDLLTDPL